MTPLTPTTRSDTASLIALQGAQLLGVTYNYLPSVDHSAYAGAGEGVDADLSSVELSFANRNPVVITWAMVGQLEGLTILRSGEEFPSLVSKTVDASETQPWRRHVGATVTSVGAAWHVSGNDVSETLWALRLDFPNESVVIALGMADPAISYMPDELVVLFGRSQATAYKPNHVNESSWGQLLGPI